MRDGPWQMATTPTFKDEQLEQRLASAFGVTTVPVDEVPVDHRRRYGLAIGGQRFLLELSQSVHVVAVASAHRLPNTHPWMLGLVNLRGSLVPLYDLAACFDLTPSPLDRRMMLVLGDGDDAAAAIIDGPPRHMLVGDNQRVEQMPILHEMLVPLALSAHRLSDGVWVALNWYELFRVLKDRSLTRHSSAGARGAHS